MTISAASAAPANHRGLWRAAQAIGLVLTVALLAGLVTHPELTLKILWNAVVPVLPAVFLVNPAIWRNTCPLATLTMLPGGRSAGRSIGESTVRTATIAGIVLLLVLVPARRFLFNTDGTALAVTITAVAALALAGGFGFTRKAGFCNSLCPVLPVERLYGQRPLLAVRNVRCSPCIGCTKRGCIDLSPADSVHTVIGPRWPSSWWVISPYGMFAAAFPGFIVGYYTLTNGTLAEAAEVYRHVLVAMALSAAAVLLAVRVLRVSAAVGLPLLAAAAAGLYYWYAAQVIADAWGLGGIGALGIRTAASGLITVWLVRALPAARSGAA